MFPRVRGRSSCSRLHRHVTAHCSSIPASTSRASRGCAWDHGRWPPVVNRAVVGRPGWRSARHPRPVVGRQLLRPAGRTARHPRPASLLASASWPQGSGPAWDWPSSGLGVGPAPTNLVGLSATWCWLLMSGRAVCPALGPGGRWTPWHATRPPGASGGVNEVGAPRSRCRPSAAQDPAWLVGRLRLGVGHAIYRSARSLHPGAVGEQGSPPRGLLATRPRLSRQQAPGTRRWRRRCARSSAAADPRRRPPRRRGSGAAAPSARSRPAGQQFLPGGQPEQVYEPARAVAEEHGPMEARAGEGAGDGLAGCLGIGGSNPVATRPVARSPERPGKLHPPPAEAWPNVVV
jgi:hypothetical protein